MTELSVDRTNEAQAEVKTAEHALVIAQAADLRAKSEALRTEVAKRATDAQLGTVASALASLDAQACNADPKNGPAIRRLSAEQSDLGIQRRALEGQKQREQEQLAEAQAQVDAASAALRVAEDTLQKARGHLTDCERDALVARKVAAGEPLTQYEAERVAFRERMEEEDHLRKVRYTWDLAQREWDSVVRPTLSREKHDHELQLMFDRLWAEKYGGKPPSAEPSPPAVETEPAKKPLAANEVAWGTHARSFDSAPAPVAGVGFKGGTGKGEYDPFAAEND